MGFVAHGILSQTLMEGGIIRAYGSKLSLHKRSPVNKAKFWDAGVVHPKTFQRMKESGEIKLLKVTDGLEVYVRAKGAAG